MSTSTTPKKRRSRYSKAKKREVLTFMRQYNAEHGRGGRTAAANKFNVYPGSIDLWRRQSSQEEVQPSDGRNTLAEELTSLVAEPHTAPAAEKDANGHYPQAVRDKALAFFDKHGNASAAARHAGVGVVNVYYWKKQRAKKNGTSLPTQKQKAEASKKAITPENRAAEPVQHVAQEQASTVPTVELSHCPCCGADIESAIKAVREANN